MNINTVPNDFYDPALVDETTRNFLIERLADYDSGKVCWNLDQVAIKLLKARSEQEVSYSFSTVVEMNRWLWHEREARYCFYTLLRDRVIYDADRLRLPNGSLTIEWEGLVNLVRPIVQPLPFPQRINTWLRVCVDWLEICNLEWFTLDADYLAYRRSFKDNPEWAEPPEDERLYFRWIPQFILDCTFLYG